MVEQFFWRILILIITCFASSATFSASYYLQMRELSLFLSNNETITFIGLEHFLLGVANIPTLLASSWRGVNIWLAIIWFGLVLVLISGYVWWMDKRGSVWLESRRLHKSRAAMEIIYAFVLIFAFYIILGDCMAVNVYSSLIIFLLSFVVMMRFGRRIPLYIYFIIAITIAYFLV